MGEPIVGEVVDEPGTALAVHRDAELSVFGAGSAQERVDQMVEVAQAFVGLARKRDAEARAAGRAPLIIPMKNKKTGVTSEYITLPLWQTLGMMPRNAITSTTVWTRKLENGWEARAVARTLDGREVSAAESQCTRDEDRWKYSDENGIRSMAQTRALSKSLRSALGFLVVLAGFEATPAEEMPADPPAKPAEFDRAKQYRRLGALINDYAKLSPDGEALKDDEQRHASLLKLYGKESYDDLTPEQLKDWERRLRSQIKKAS